MNCCKHKYFVLYRGDSSDFPGNQELIVEINTTRDLTGCSAHFQFQGFTQDFDEIPADKKLHLIFPSSETKKFALGASDAKLWLTYGSGADEKTRTVENRIHVVVTNRVDEAYDNDDPKAITVTISGGGGGATVVLDDTVTETSSNGVKSSGIWSWVKSLLPNWLTSDYAEPATVASVENKRDKDDLAVYEEHLGPWTHGELVEWYKITAEQPEHDSSLWFWYGEWLDASGGHYTSVAQAPFVSEDQTSIVFTVSAHPSGNPPGFTFTATRTTSIATKPNQKFAAVATGDAQTPANGDLVKYDATNDRIVKAIPSSAGGESADYRDPKDAKCYESVDSWTWEFSDGLTHELPDPVWNVESPVSHWTVGSDVPESPEAYDENATSLRFIASQTWPKDYSATATRHLIATKDKPFVTADNAARSLECGEGDAKQTVTVENGVAKLDDFFTESNSLLNGRLAYSRNATGLKDRAFNTLSFDGTEYNLSTALAAVTPTASGQPRDLLIVATATAATTISFTAGTIKGDKPTIDGSGTWLITLTEYASGVWYCRQIKMEDVA